MAAGVVCVLLGVSFKDKIRGLWLLIVVEADILLLVLFGNFEQQDGGMLGPAVWATEDVAFVLASLVMRQSLWNREFIRVRSWWRIAVGGLGILLGYQILVSMYDIAYSRPIAGVSVHLERLRGLVIGGGLFSILGEDLLFWGSLYPLMRLRIGPAWATVMIATFFSSEHFGVRIPGAIVYGFLASCLRDVSGGIVVCALVHVSADTIIAALPVLLMGVFGDRLTSPYLWLSLSIAVLCLGCLAIGGQDFFRRFGGWFREWRLRPIKGT